MDWVNDIQHHLTCEYECRSNYHVSSMFFIRAKPGTGSDEQVMDLAVALMSKPI